MKINNKGYASTIIMFSILTLFLISMLMLVKTMNNSSTLNKRITEKVVDNINYDASGTMQDRLTALENTVSNLQNQLFNTEKNVIAKIYPVGSIYMSTEDDTVEKVQSKFGGIWEKYAQGRTLIGEGTGTDSNGIVKTFKNSSTGGEYTHNHKSPLTWIQGQSTLNSWVGTTNYYGYTVVEDRDFYGTSITKVVSDKVTPKLIYNTSTESNLPPYLSVYMYKRVN